MKYLSVCSGIEAATVAWHPLGWTPAAFAEVDKFPSAVLAHHYPTVPNWGDMTKFKDWPDAKLDLLVGGTPCQSFSVAGLRQGLDDPRGSLLLVYLAIADRYRPSWLVWENVPGVLSSDDGRAFGSLLGGLAELGYGFAYRVLDAQYFGLAQRRRRVFVVGHLGDWRRAAAVLFERESLSWHPAPRREAGTVVTQALTGRLGGGGADDNKAQGHFYVGERARALTACKTATGRLDPNEMEFIAHSLRADGFDASEDGTGRGTPLVPMPYTLAIRGRGDSHDLEYRQDGTANALLTPNGGRGGIGVGAVAFDTTQITSKANYSNPKPGDPCHPLAAGAHPPAVAFAIQGAATRENASSGPDGVGVRGDDCAYTLEARSEVQAVAFAEVGACDLAETLSVDANQTTGFKSDIASFGMQVRRLTPRECERLQGFPDDYTLIPYRGKPAADGPRYKALGNSMAVPCMAWIGNRIQMVEDVSSRPQERTQ